MAFAVASHPLATMDLNGTGGNVLLVCYIIGGIALIVTSLLPGNTTGWKIIGALIGAVFIVWAAYVLVFGGWIIISFKVLILPVIGVIRALVSMSRRSRAPMPPAYGAGQAPYVPPGTQNWGQMPGQPMMPNQPMQAPMQAPMQPPMPQQPYVPPGTQNWGQPPQAPQPPQSGWS